MVKEKIVNFGKEKDSAQELKSTIRKLKAKVRRQEKEIARLKSELKTSDKGFKKSQKHVEELTDTLSLEEAIDTANKLSKQKPKLLNKSEKQKLVDDLVKSYSRRKNDKEK